jgi:hypothetical protein
MSEEQTPERGPVDEESRKGISRREFARRAAIASAVASLAPAQAVAAPSPRPVTPAEPGQGAPPSQPPPSQSPTAQAPPAQPSPAAQTANLPKLSAESQAEAEARLQAILGRYGSRFSDEQKADLHRLCFMVQPPLDRLRAYNIENGVSPALYLKPLVEREKKPASPPAASRPTSPKTPATPATNTPPPAKPPAAPKKP